MCKTFKLKFVVALATIALLINSLTCWAQYGTDKNSSRYNVIEFPRFFVENLADRTFFVKASGEGLVFNMFSPEELAERVKIDGWTRVQLPENAYMTVEIEFGNLMLETIDAETKGSVALKGEPTISYAPFFTYTFPIHIHFNSSAFQYTKSINYDNFDGKVSRTRKIDKSFPTRREATEYVKNNKETFLADLASNQVESTLKTASSEGTYRFGYGSTTDRVEYYILDSKKSPFFEEQKTDAQLLKNIYSKSSAYSPLPADDLKPIIKRYENIIESLDDSDRKQKKAKIHLMATIGEIYLSLDNLDKCREWAQKLVNLYDEEDGKDLLDNVNKIEKLFAKYKVSSRHFLPVGPEVKENIPENNPAPAAQPQVVERVIEKVVEKEVKAKDPVCTASVNGDIFEYDTYRDAFNAHAREKGSTKSVYIKARKPYVCDYFMDFARMNGGNVTVDLNEQSVYGQMATFVLVSSGNLILTGKGRISLSGSGGSALSGNGNFTVDLDGTIEAHTPIDLGKGAKMTFIKGDVSSTNHECIRVTMGAKLILQGGRFEKAKGAECVIYVDEESSVSLAPGYEYVYFEQHDGVSSLREIKGNVLYDGYVRKIQ